jgi:hypothetical protein
LNHAETLFPSTRSDSDDVKNGQLGMLHDKQKTPAIVRLRRISLGSGHSDFAVPKLRKLAFNGLHNDDRLRQLHWSRKASCEPEKD